VEVVGVAVAPTRPSLRSLRLEQTTASSRLSPGGRVRTCASREHARYFHMETSAMAWSPTANTPTRLR